MKPINLFLSYFLFILLFGCKTEVKSPQNNPNNAQHNQKDISELSYIEIYEVLFADGNGGFDAHGDLYGQNAISNAKIVNDSDPNCGDRQSITSMDKEQNITLAVKATFNFSGNPHKEMIRAYTLKPAAQISIGNTILCYNGKEYTIHREIVSAGFTNN